MNNNLPNNFSLGTSGWICPKCGAVMGPNFPTCYYCKPNNKIVTTSGTGACPHCHFAHTQDVDCEGRKGRK